MIIPRENKIMINSVQKSYISGFLDGDGSIYVSVKNNHTYKYDYQISPNIVFFQSTKNEYVLKNIQSIINCGNIRKRKDDMSELVINKLEDISFLLNDVLIYSFAKKEQIKILKEILKLKSNIENKEDFNSLLILVKDLRKINYSKNNL